MLRVDGRVLRPRDIVAGGERVALDAPDEDAVPDVAQALPLAIAWEDDATSSSWTSPPGSSCIPARAIRTARCRTRCLRTTPRLAKLPRAGIVHRLDKDTSGLLIVARTKPARTTLAEALAARDIHREYQAVCVGVMTAGGTDRRADRSASRSTACAWPCARAGARPSRNYRVIERFRRHTWVRVTLETGRTHQIRLHLSHAGYPLVGDPVYGRRLAIPRGATPVLAEALHGFRRQALHAAKLVFPHPRDGRAIEVEAPLPADLKALIAALKRDRSAAEA